MRFINNIGLPIGMRPDSALGSVVVLGRCARTVAWRERRGRLTVWGLRRLAGALAGPASGSQSRPPELPDGPTTLSTGLVPAPPGFTRAGRLALAGFLAGYTGLTRQACELDLLPYTSWC